MDIQLAQAPIKRDRILSIVEKSPVSKELANVQAEEAVIAGVLQNPAHYLTLGELLTNADFSDRLHYCIWQVFSDLTNTHTPIDLLTATEGLLKYQEHVILDRHQITQKLGVLLALTPSEKNVLHHAEMVRDAALRIRLYEACSDIMTMTRNKTLPTEQIIDTSEVKFHKACESLGMQAMDSATHFQNTVKTLHNASTRTSVKTGFHEMDAHTGGLYPGRVSVFAGFSGTGKSTWALSMIRNVCKSGKRVALFTMEMTAFDVTLEFISMEMGLWRSKLRSGVMSPQEWQMVDIGGKEISSWKLDIIDNLPRNSPAAIRRTIRRLQNPNPIDLVVVDGLWLTEADDASNTDEQWRVYQVNMKKFIRMAKDLNVPIFILHQYSGDYKNADKPTADMLMGGQSIHNDPQEIYGLWRKKDDAKTLVYHLKQRGGTLHKHPFRFFYDHDFNSYVEYEEVNDVAF